MFPGDLLRFLRHLGTIRSQGPKKVAVGSWFFLAAWQFNYCNSEIPRCYASFCLIDDSNIFPTGFSSPILPKKNNVCWWLRPKCGWWLNHISFVCFWTTIFGWISGAFLLEIPGCLLLLYIPTVYPWSWGLQGYEPWTKHPNIMLLNHFY